MSLTIIYCPKCGRKMVGESPGHRPETHIYLAAHRRGDADTVITCDAGGRYYRLDQVVPGSKLSHPVCPDCHERHAPAGRCEAREWFESKRY